MTNAFFFFFVMSFQNNINPFILDLNLRLQVLQLHVFFVEMSQSQESKFCVFLLIKEDHSLPLDNAS